MSPSARITVLHLRCCNYHGGPETSLLGWLKFMDRGRFDPRVLFFDERYGLHYRSLEIFSDHGVPVEIVPWGQRRDLRGALRSVAGKVRESWPCVLHAHDVRSDFIALIVGRMTGTPVVISNHAWHAVGLKRHIFEACRGFWLRFADQVVNVSRDTDRETIKRGVPRDRSMTIYSGLDLTPYRDPLPREQAKARIGLRADDLVVGDVARMWPEKAIHVLIEAAARLAPEYPSLRVVLVGDGPLEADLRARAEHLGVQDNVVFLGFRKDLVEVMAAFDIFALPSLAEGTPMVIYSAMALGLPIAASPVSGVAELLDDEVTALLTRPADTDSMTAALARLLRDPALRQRLGAAAKARMEERYSAAVAVRAFERLYEELIERRQSRNIHVGQTNA